MRFTNARRRCGVAHRAGFYYEPEPSVPLSTEVVFAIAKAHDERVLEPTWCISDDINTDALDGLFQNHQVDTTLQFEADTATVTIIADANGNPIIKIESHR
jgi:hypothetical protein